MMPCCGDSRAKPDQAVTFEYTGEGRFTIFGRVTGMRFVLVEATERVMRYSVPAPGARVLADRRDAPALEIVQALERVSDASEAAEGAEKSARGGAEKDGAVLN